MPSRRFGDKALMGYIEYMENDLQKYEEASEAEKVE